MSEEEYIVEAVIGKRVFRGKTQYRLRWKGWEEPTWEDAASCDCHDLIAAFEAQQTALELSNSASSAKKKRGRTAGSGRKKAAPSSDSSNEPQEVAKKKRGRPPGKKAASDESNSSLGSEDGDGEKDEEEDNEPSEWEVEDILDERKSGKDLEYLVKWKGWSAKDSTWEHKSHLDNCPAVIARWRKVKADRNVRNQPKTPVPQARALKKTMKRPRGGSASGDMGLRNGREELPIVAIIAKEKKGSSTRYLVEWGPDGEYLAGARSWEPKVNILSQDPINQFEKGNRVAKKDNSAKKDTPSKKKKPSRQLVKIVGAKSENDEIFLACEFDNHESETIPHSEVAALYPDKLIEYYSQRVKFIPRSEKSPHKTPKMRE